VGRHQPEKHTAPGQHASSLAQLAAGWQNPSVPHMKPSSHWVCERQRRSGAASPAEHPKHAIASRKADLIALGGAIA
jgi:hypothetical protein